MSSGVWIVADIDPRKRGSFEQQQVALVRALRARSVPVTCVYARPPAAYPGDELRAAGAEVRWVDFRAPGATRVLWRWLRAARPALVHFNFVRAFSAPVLAARLAGSRVVVHDRLVLATPRPLSPWDALKRIRAHAFAWAFDRRLAVSPAVARSIVAQDRVSHERIRIVENGIELQRFASSDGARLRATLGIGDAPLLCAVARLDDEKGVESAVRALPLIGGGAHLAVAGQGPLQAELARLSQKLGVGDRFHLLGARNDVEEILAAATVVVAPTHGIEAFGFVVAEAMAAGKPVVVTDSGGMPWVAGEGGLVVRRRDPAGLAEAINRLLDDDLLRRRMAASGRRRAQQKFALDRWVRRVLAVYEELLGACFEPNDVRSVA